MSRPTPSDAGACRRARTSWPDTSTPTARRYRIPRARSIGRIETRSSHGCSRNETTLLIDRNPVVIRRRRCEPGRAGRSEEHTSELQSLMRISYAVFCLKKKKIIKHQCNTNITEQQYLSI